MPRPRGFTALDLEGLSDQELNDLVLSNWAKLNKVLMAKQPIPVLRRLLALELTRGKQVRPLIAERLRSALFRARTQESGRALERVLEAFYAGEQADVCDFELLDLSMMYIDDVHKEG